MTKMSKAQYSGQMKGLYPEKIIAWWSAPGWGYERVIV